MPSSPARACSVGGWPVLYEAKRARTVLHGSQRRWPISFEAASADLARCRQRSFSTNGVRWCASRFGREDNHAKSASKRALRGPSVGSPRGEATVGRAARESTTVTMRLRSHRRGRFLWSRRLALPAPVVVREHYLVTVEACPIPIFPVVLPHPVETRPHPKGGC